MPVILEAIKGWVIFLIVLAAVVVIALVAFSLYRFLRPKMKIDDKPSEQEIVNEEMNRILKPIDDDETARAVNEYKDEEE